MNTLIKVLITFLIISCKYQNPEVLLSSQVSEETETISDDFTPIKTDATLEENLRQYFDEYVVTSSKRNYDTSIDYQKLLDHHLGKDKDYFKIRNKILSNIQGKRITANTSFNEKLAFYINTYNFYAIDAVILFSLKKKKLIKSVANIGGIGSFKVFKSNKVYPINVAGKSKMTLDDIEHKIIRVMVKNSDARIHFALICASKGCPILSHAPFTEKNVQSKLDEITRDGLKLKRILNIQGNTIALSKIFKWFKEDFVSHGQKIHFDRTGNLLNLKNNSTLLIKEFLQNYSNKKIDKKIKYIDYDWTLNILK